MLYNQWRNITLLFTKYITLFFLLPRKGRNGCMCVCVCVWERERERLRTAMIDITWDIYSRVSQGLLGFTSCLLNLHWDTFFRTFLLVILSLETSAPSYRFSPESSNVWPNLSTRVIPLSFHNIHNAYTFPSDSQFTCFISALPYLP